MINELINIFSQRGWWGYLERLDSQRNPINGIYIDALRHLNLEGNKIHQLKIFKKNYMGLDATKPVFRVSDGKTQTSLLRYRD